MSGTPLLGKEKEEEEEVKGKEETEEESCCHTLTSSFFLPRAFAVVASALGIPSLLPFLKAVCRSKKSWQARHTGIKIVQQIAILMGCAVLPHLKSMVEIVENGLHDEQQKVRTITALAIAALAEAATPYGIESFESVLVPIMTDGIWNHRGKVSEERVGDICVVNPLSTTSSSSSVWLHSSRRADT